MFVWREQLKESKFVWHFIKREILLSEIIQNVSGPKQLKRLKVIIALNLL